MRITEQVFFKGFNDSETHIKVGDSDGKRNGMMEITWSDIPTNQSNVSTTSSTNLTSRDSNHKDADKANTITQS